MDVQIAYRNKAAVTVVKVLAADADLDWNFVLLR